MEDWVYKQPIYDYMCLRREMDIAQIVWLFELSNLEPKTWERERERVYIGFSHDKHFTKMDMIVQ